MPAMDKGRARSELRGLAALDGRDGPALAITEAELRAHVASLLERAPRVVSLAPLASAGERHSLTRKLGGTTPLDAAAPSTLQRPVGHWRRAPVVALAIVATTTAAAAAVYRADGVVEWLRDRVRAEPAAHAPSSPPPKTSAAPRDDLPSAAPPSEPASLEPASMEPASIDAPREVASPPPRARRPRPTRPEPPSATRRVAASLLRFEAMAVDVLERANTARRARRYSDALDDYSSVVERYPNSLQAQAARVAAAALWLEQFHDTRAAERLYASALARGGELTVEARHGLAEVYRARGDSARERAARVEIVQAHPQHPLADTARARLRDMQR
jgi:tetratricopeptide (TPR) repeat protein